MCHKIDKKCHKNNNMTSKNQVRALVHIFHAVFANIKRDDLWKVLDVSFAKNAKKSLFNLVPVHRSKFFIFLNDFFKFSHSWSIFFKVFFYYIPTVSTMVKNSGWSNINPSHVIVANQIAVILVIPSERL
jgi:hypothetical protein